MVGIDKTRLERKQHGQKVIFLLFPVSSSGLGNKQEEEKIFSHPPLSRAHVTSQLGILPRFRVRCALRGAFLLHPVFLPRLPTPRERVGHSHNWVRRGQHVRGWELSCFDPRAEGNEEKIQSLFFALSWVVIAVSGFRGT